jgi:transcriptional regulator with XRE-family HTH domain
MPTRDEVMIQVTRLGSQTKAAKALGISKQRVSQILRRKESSGKRGRPPGSRNARPKAHYVIEDLAEKTPYYNGPVRPNKTRLQVCGVYSKAQQDLRVALKGVNRRALARDLGYSSSNMIGWYLNGAVPHPTLRIAVELERRFGVRCVDWFAPPVSCERMNHEEGTEGAEEKQDR